MVGLLLVAGADQIYYFGAEVGRKSRAEPEKGRDVVPVCRLPGVAHTNIPLSS